MGSVRSIAANQIKSLVHEGACQDYKSTDELVHTAQCSGSINVVTSDADRRDEMKKFLNLPEQGLSEPEVKELERFLLGSYDVFSLDDDDLGHTSPVQHHVDTGDYARIKQPPCRLPFSRRENSV